MNYTLRGSVSEEAMPQTTARGVSPSLARRVSKACGHSALLCLFLAAGCRQQMAVQPAYRPLEPSAFFSDGQSARPIPAGTVARGQPLSGDRLATGKTGLGQALADYATAFPVAINGELLQRGRERYTIYCSVCHDNAGTGRGTIVERGYTRPPSFVTDDSRGFRLRGEQVALPDAPVGYYFEVVTDGFGAMPSYAVQVPPRDRWAIIAYIRALQLAGHARLADLPESEREAARKAIDREDRNEP
jgi:mono/diheme cytochrome c family protein